MNQFLTLVCPERPARVSGQSLIEYALVLILIGLVCITSMGQMGLTINDIFVRFTQDGFTTAPGQPPTGP